MRLRLPGVPLGLACSKPGPRAPQTPLRGEVPTFVTFSLRPAPEVVGLASDMRYSSFHTVCWSDQAYTGPRYVSVCSHLSNIPHKEGRLWLSMFT